MGEYDELTVLCMRRDALRGELEAHFPPTSAHDRRVRHAMLDELALVEQRIAIEELRVERAKWA